MKYKENIGRRVMKRSKKPFKSQRQINTVTDVVVNEQDPERREAYTFVEDDSVVNCCLCNVLEDGGYIRYK